MRLNRYLTEKKVGLTGDQHKDRFLAQLNQWDTDLSKMTKAYKSIKGKKEDYFEDPRLSLGFDLKGWKKTPDMKKYFKLKKAFNIFGNNFDNWVYKKILDPKESKKEGIYRDNVRTTAWTFLSDIRVYSLFESHNTNIYDNQTMYSIPMIWSKSWDKIVKTNVTRYQRSWRKFKEALEELIVNWGENLRSISGKDEQIQVSGVNIVIKNKGVRNGIDDDTKYVKKFVQHIKPVLSAIKKEGMNIAIRDFSIELNFDVSSVDRVYSHSGDMVGGAYDVTTDELYMFPLADLKPTGSTLIHEIGHRFWFRNVPEKAKNAWRDKFQNQRVTLKKDHIKKFFDEFWDKEWGFPFRKELKKKIEAIKDPTLQIIYGYLAKHTPVYKVEGDRSDEKKAYFEFMVKHNEGEKLPIEWISDYARTNEKESFAEAFKIWVGGQKGKLGAWTRAFFKEIVATGGVNIREEKLVNKYLKE